MGPVNSDWIDNIIDGTLTIVDILVPMVVTAGLIVFFWGVIKFISQADDPRAREQGKMLMIWGIIGLFVMVSIFGIIAIINNLFFIDQGGSGAAPGINNINPL